MIVKVVNKKSDGGSFAKLANYLLDEQLNKERVQSHAFENCNCETIEDNITEIRVTQEINTRTKSDKTYHLIVSFQDNESPTPDTLKKIEAELAKMLGFETHQRLSVIHGDTNNLHMHIAINRIDPETYLAVSPYFDKLNLQKKAIELEEKYHLKRDNHSRGMDKEPGHIKDKEIHSGVQSFYTWVKDNVTVELSQILKDETKTFIDLQKTLNKYNLELRERGAGFVISDKDRALYVKASDIDRNLSKTRLIERFGEIVPQRLQMPSEVKFGHNKSNLWNEYQTQTKQNRELKAVELERLAKHRQAAFEKLNSEYAKKRDSIKKDTSLNKNVKRAAYELLAEHKLKESKAIKTEYATGKQEVYARYKTETYHDFLTGKAISGDKQAMNVLQKKQENDTATKLLPGQEPKISKQGLVFYNLRNGKIIDDGKTLRLTGARSKENIGKLEDLAKIRFGKDNFKFYGYMAKKIDEMDKNPLEAFKRRINEMHDRKIGKEPDKGYLERAKERIKQSKEMIENLINGDRRDKASAGDKAYEIRNGMSNDQKEQLREKFAANTMEKTNDRSKGMER